MCWFIECAASRSNKLGSTQSKKLLGQETEPVQAGHGKHRKRNPKAALRDVPKGQSTSCCEVQTGLLREVLPSWPFMLNSLCQCPSGRGPGRRAGGARHRHAHPGRAGPSSRALSLFSRVNKGLIVEESGVCSKNKPPEPRTGAPGTSRSLSGCRGVSLGEAEVHSCFSPSEAGPEGCELSNGPRKTVI